MSATKQVSNQWSTTQAYTLAVLCLFAGIAAGWLFRGSQSPARTALVESASASTPVGGGTNSQPTPEQMKKMADTQAAPLVEKLKSDSADPDLLASIGNIYYDTQIY